MLGRKRCGASAASTGNLGELRAHQVRGGFPPALDEALRRVPGLLEAVAARVLETSIPATLHAGIAAAVGLSLDRPVPHVASEADAPAHGAADRRRRDPGSCERVLRACEHHGCICGFDLRIGQLSAGLEAAHIQWQHVGGPDIEPNGLALCALHRKLFDLGAFTVGPAEHRVVFSQHAISGGRGLQGALRHHGQQLLAPQQADMRPAPGFLAWNRNVFKTPARQVDGASGPEPQVRA